MLKKRFGLNLLIKHSFSTSRPSQGKQSYQVILNAMNKANTDFKEAMNAHTEKGRCFFYGTGLLGQTKTGFSEWCNQEVFDIAEKFFPKEIKALKLKEKGYQPSTVKIVPFDRKKFPTDSFDDNFQHAFAGGPAALFAASAQARLKQRVLFINNGFRGIHHGSARVLHVEESQQNENSICYNPTAILTYILRSILPPEFEKVDKHYLRVDAIAPGTLSSLRNIINWHLVMGGMFGNVVANHCNEMVFGKAQWYEDIKQARFSPLILQWLQEALDEPLLYKGAINDGFSMEPRGVGPYVYVAIGKESIARREHYNKKLEKYSGIQQCQLDQKELMSLFPGARDDILNGSLVGWTLAGNGVINPQYEKILENLIEKRGGEVRKESLTKIFVNNDGDVEGIQTSNGRNFSHYKLKTLLTSLGHADVLLGNDERNIWSQLYHYRSPFKASIPATGTSVTGISVARGKIPQIHASVGTTNMHRNQLASVSLGNDKWAVLWRTTTGGNVGGPIVKNGKEEVQTYPTYYQSAKAIQEYLFGLNGKHPLYESEAAFSVKACPRQLTADEKPTLYYSGPNKTLGMWTGWQGLGVERPPSVVFQHALLHSPELLDSFSKSTQLTKTQLRDLAFNQYNMTRSVKAVK